MVHSYTCLIRHIQYTYTEIIHDAWCMHTQLWWEMVHTYTPVIRHGPFKRMIRQGPYILMCDQTSSIHRLDISQAYVLLQRSWVCPLPSLGLQTGHVVRSRLHTQYYVWYAVLQSRQVPGQLGRLQGFIGLGLQSALGRCYWHRLWVG